MGFDFTSLSNQRFDAPAGWRVVRVRDVAVINELSIKNSYPHDTIEYIDIASVERGVIYSVQELPLVGAPSRAKRIVRDNDTLISTVRPNLEHYAFVKKPKSNTIASTGFAIVTAKSMDPRYLYYYLTTRPFTAYLSQIADSHTSAYPAINPDVIETAELLLPPIDEQHAIAHILGTLDDKIELNRQMNRTLEVMAQALFKNWFVDFEPFRDQGMQNSPLGETPVGWRVGKLSELCKTQYGYTASAIEEPVGPHLLRVMDINKQNWIEWDKVPYCEIADEDITEYRLEVGDLVVARMADPGKSAIIEQPADAVFASYLVRLKTESMAHAYFVYGFLKSQAYADYSEGAMGGSSVQKSMNAKVIVDVDLVIPPTQVLEKFLQYVLPLRKRLAANVDQSATLTSNRGALLPKLLSGEIRVKDAERFLESSPAKHPLGNEGNDSLKVPGGDI